LPDNFYCFFKHRKKLDLNDLKCIISIKQMRIRTNTNFIKFATWCRFSMLPDINENKVTFSQIFSWPIKLVTNKRLNANLVTVASFIQHHVEWQESKVTFFLHELQPILDIYIISYQDLFFDSFVTFSFLWQRWSNWPYTKKIVCINYLIHSIVCVMSRPTNLFTMSQPTN